MTSWIVRQAQPEDAEGLARCLDSAYAQYRGKIDDLPPVSEDCAGEIERHLVWIVEIGGAIVGGLVLAPSEDCMVLANLAVDPAHRGRGMARRLLALSQSEALDRGYSEMRLATHVEMPENVGFYERDGWQRGATEGNKIKMSKRLVV